MIKSFIKVIHSELFWSAIGSIATAVACIIALWQTSYINKKKIKLQFSSDVKILTNNHEQFNFIAVDIINTGNRKINITEWSMLTKIKNRKYIILTNIVSVLPVKLPQFIDIEDKLSLFYEYDKFIEVLQTCIDKQELKANDKIKFVIKDSTGNKYTIKSDKTVKEYLEIRE